MHDFPASRLKVSRLGRSSLISRRGGHRQEATSRLSLSHSSLGVSDQESDFPCSLVPTLLPSTLAVAALWRAEACIQAAAHRDHATSHLPGKCESGIIILRMWQCLVESCVWTFSCVYVTVYWYGAVVALCRLQQLSGHIGCFYWLREAILKPCSAHKKSRIFAVWGGRDDEDVQKWDIDGFCLIFRNLRGCGCPLPLNSPGCPCWSPAV